MGGTDLFFPSARHQLTLRDHGYGASASHGVPVHVPAFTGTQCTHPQRDGQAELTWVAGYTLRWFNCLSTVTYYLSVCWNCLSLCPLTNSSVCSENFLTVLLVVHCQLCINWHDILTHIPHSVPSVVVLCDVFDTSISVVSTSVSIPVSKRPWYIAVPHYRQVSCHDETCFRFYCWQHDSNDKARHIKAIFVN